MTDTISLATKICAATLTYLSLTVVFLIKE